VSKATREDARYLSLGLRSIHPAHVEQAATHLAKSLNAAVADGRMTPEQLEKMGEDEISDRFAQIARDNPRIARPADPAPVPRRPTAAPHRVPHNYIPESKGK
jgi:hypothetical protein